MHAQHCCARMVAVLSDLASVSGKLGMLFLKVSMLQAWSFACFLRKEIPSLCAQWSKGLQCYCCKNSSLPFYESYKYASLPPLPYTENQELIKSESTTFVFFRKADVCGERGYCFPYLGKQINRGQAGKKIPPSYVTRQSCTGNWDGERSEGPRGLDG